MVIVNSTCWRCGRDMKIAMIDTDFYGQIIFTDSFTEKEVKLANENGAYVKMNYSNQMKESYFANTCLFLKKVDSIFTLKINISISVRNLLTLLAA